MLDLSHVNVFAILVASVAGMAVGFAWYSNLLFAKAWTKLASTKMGENSTNPFLYVLNFIIYLIICFSLSQLLFYFDISGLWAGIAVGLFAFVGFAGATAFTENLFSGRSWKLFAINYGYQLVNLVVMGAILSLWR